MKSFLVITLLFLGCIFTDSAGHMQHPVDNVNSLSVVNDDTISCDVPSLERSNELTGELKNLKTSIISTKNKLARTEAKLDTLNTKIINKKLDRVFADINIE